MMGKGSKEQKNKGLLLSTVVKYAFTVLLLLLVFATGTHSKKLFVYPLIELSIIALATNCMVQRLPRITYILNSILLLLLNIQVAVYYFGNSYVSMVMIANLAFLGDLAGNAGIYITAALLVIVISFLPVRNLALPKGTAVKGIVLGLVCEILLCCIYGAEPSPAWNYGDLAYKTVRKEIMKAKIRQYTGDAEHFFHDVIESGIERPASLVKSPNIVLIFTEGLSTSIIEDERDIMPNVRKWRDLSVSFDNYYNHTAATLRGLVGQLYSGYQNNNLDTNQLVSMQSILSSKGYHTAFINTEPANATFEEYLRSFSFEEFLSNGTIDTTVYEQHGEQNSLCDNDAYKLLFDTMERLSEKSEPFFITIYTFGTHATFDSAHEIYENGQDAELNKFYNADACFGEFMEKYCASEMANDTVIIYTTDHGTYYDQAFSNAFPSAHRDHYFLDEIPLFFYHSGVTPQVVDVGGRNTLCLAPTVLDYLDISEGNFFLGSSLFTEQSSLFEVIYDDQGRRLSSAGCKIADLTREEDDWFQKELVEYYSVSNSHESEK